MMMASARSGAQFLPMWIPIHCRNKWLPILIEILTIRKSFGRLGFHHTFYQLMFSHWWCFLYLHWPQDVCTCETHSYREMFDLPTCVSCPSASDEEWMYTELEKRLNWCYIWIVEAIHFLQEFYRAVFQNPHFIGTCVTVYDWWQVWQFPFDARWNTGKEYRQKFCCAVKWWSD